MIRLFPFIFLIPLIVCCSKIDPNNKIAEPSKEKKILNFPSPIPFEFDSSLSEKGLIAVYKNIEIRNDEIRENKKSLQQLKGEIEKQIIFIGYYWASQSNKKEVQLQYWVPKPSLPLESILNEFGIQKVENINVKWAERENPNLMFTINHNEYTAENVSMSYLPLSKNRRSYFNQLMEIVESLVSRKILIQQADESSMTVNDYTRQKVFTEHSYGREEVIRFAENNNIPIGSLSDPKILERVLKIMKSEKETKEIIDHAAKIVDNASIKVSFAPPELRIHGFDLPPNAPVFGKGPLSLVLISNPTCKLCRETESELFELLKLVENKIQLTYLFHFPEGNFRNEMIAEGGLCIKEQNVDSFWDYHKAALESEFDGQEKQINELVQKLGLNFESFNKCFVARKFRSDVQSHIKAVQNLGHLNLPVLIAGDRLFTPPIDMNNINNYINGSLLDKTGNKKSSWWSWFKSLF